MGTVHRFRPRDRPRPQSASRRRTHGSLGTLRAFGRPWLAMLVLAGAAYVASGVLTDGATGQKQIVTITGTARIVDGDTIVVRGAKIRLQGLAAPEGSEDGGNAATDFMRRLVGGRVLTCTPDGTTSYDRIVAVCRLEDGQDVSAAIVEAGLGAARSAVRQPSLEPPAPLAPAPRMRHVI